ncbi:hypothetical protein ACFLWA_09065 [Chloroflexota bacterium]
MPAEDVADDTVPPDPHRGVTLLDGIYHWFAPRMGSAREASVWGEMAELKGRRL